MAIVSIDDLTELTNTQLSDNDLLLVYQDSSSLTKKIKVEKLVLPRVSASDNGKILKVVNGAWAVVSPE